MDDKWLCKKQVCDLLGVHRSTLDRWRKLSSFPKVHKPGGAKGQCRWLKTEIYDWMQTAAA